ncbi:cytochrome P450 [Annulohypoxylon maeteangense]|uniref:cytochrome P450 n=1 Tax=Annulohypoxylon maeteangense TaxID=1927788 RepID=UPI0020087F0C|nr:cytochrome P450 [Annulohypoxylon maeteangense]KAI0887011.1 cytochrome P450 [Annulohypoxylon maeteangense]
MIELFLFAIVALLFSYLYTKLKYLRLLQYAHIPQLPNHLLWGHLKTFGEFMQRGIHDRHPDKIFEEMWASLGRPPIMLVDLRPINPPMALISSHDIAEQISKPSKHFPLSTPKSPTWTHMIPLIGSTSILGREGLDWKDLRKRYNPGFTAQHLSCHLPLIIEKTEPFWTYLDRFSASGEEFSLETLISNLTFDVIGAAVLEMNLNAQVTDSSKQSEVIRLFRELVQTYNDDKNNLPWWIDPLTALKRKRLARRIDTLVKRIIQQKYIETKEEAEGNRSKSILALSFQSTEELTPQLLSTTSDQIRSFLFAGHDTNTSALQWIFYELSRTPRALKAVRDELDEVLGPDSDPLAISAILAQEGEHLLPCMQYINAVIKETLRLHPPASTVRMTEPGTGFTVRASTGEEYCLDGVIMYSCQSIIQRDSAVYGDTADDWVPERWLGEAAKDIPPSAWRPFERGPRNCIGPELANLESRIIVAIVARKYDFIKAGLGESVLDEKGLPMINEKGQYKVKSELYNTRRMTSKPVDGTMMRVKRVAKP